ncbi:thioesterase II family protein [Streptomyces pratensis]|jgi:surfactin synthase thioesterase subunit|uniref:thioesterase II family protein n=1 Tax=Streptomyces pratensis TaxID=1169025 RepID=UPI00362964E5
MSSPISAQDLWIRAFHPAPQAPHRLVCFPHAGGSASFYFPVSAGLAPEVDVLAVQYPGRQDRRAEPGIVDIGVMADRVAEALLPYAARSPLTFFGHSMGACVAFEVARRLERTGRGPAHIFASGRRAPSSCRDEDVHLRDDDGIIAEMRAMSGTDARVLGDEELLRMVLPAIRSDYRAVETYRADPDASVNCPVTALIGDDDPWTTHDEARAWEKHTTGPFGLTVFSGGHFYLSSRADEVMAVLKEHFDTRGATR